MTKPTTPPPRPALRLIRAGDTGKGAASAAPKTAPAAPPASPRSALGKALTAYADAIDRDIKLLLEL